MSVKVNWAPGWASFRRAMARVPGGQPDRSTRAVISATQGTLPQLAAIGGDSWDPVSFGDRQGGQRHGPGQGVTDTEAHLAVPAGVQEVVRAAGRIGSGDDLMVVRADWQLSQPRVEHLDVIDSGATTGVARSQ